MNSIPFALGVVSMIDENIVCVTLEEDGEVDEVIIGELIQATIKMSEGKPHAILQDYNNKIVSSTPAVKKLVSVRTEKESLVFARAFVTYNLHNQLEINHFIQYYKPDILSRIFKTKEDALVWLRAINAERNKDKQA
jgi:hypothetical protein